MLNVTLDPGLFAPPFDDRSKEGVKNYVDALMHWRDVSASRLARTHVPKHTAATLIESRYFPLRDWLQELLVVTGTYEFDVNTIARAAQSILDQSVWLEDSASISDVLAAQIALAPSIFANYVPQPIQFASERAALIIALVRAVGADPFAVSNSLAVRDRCGSPMTAVSALLEIIEHTRQDLRDYDDLPKPFHGSFPACETFHDYLMSLDECLLWKAIRGTDDLETLIKVCVYKSNVLRGDRRGFNSAPPFRLHRDFYSSIRRCGMTSSPPMVRTFLRAVAEAVERQNMAATHILRVDAGANSDQATRGKDKAWRRDIDRDFHLHYWQCDGGTVELACVVHHGDSTIYQ